MSDPAPFRPAGAGAQPAYDTPSYASTAKRHPKAAFIAVPTTLTEATGPRFSPSHFPALADLSMTAGKPADSALLSAILSKFLYYRVLNLVDSKVTGGWDELKKDLRAFDPRKFPIASSPESPTTPIEEIEQNVTNSLKARGPLEADIQRYTSKPLARN